MADQEIVSRKRTELGDLAGRVGKGAVTSAERLVAGPPAPRLRRVQARLRTFGYDCGV